MTARAGSMLWDRRAEFVRDGIPSDIYRQQIALAQGLRLKAYGRLINRVALAVRTALLPEALVAHSGAQGVQYEKRP